MTQQSPITFGAPMLPVPERFAALMTEILGNGWLTNGGELHSRLEKELCRRQFHGDTASLTSSGTMALMLSLLLGNLPAGAEVITTPLTFSATAQAIAALGLVPVFADVDPATLALCPGAAERAITPRTAAILPVHFLGLPCDVTAFADIANRHGLWLVYDAAQAFGVTVDDIPVDHFGDASAFSLHATKILHSAEGGYVSTDAAHTSALHKMRNFGLSQGVPVSPGLNGKMSEINAAMALALLPDLDAEMAARARLRAAYDVAFQDIAELHLLKPPLGASASLGYYALRISREHYSGLLRTLHEQRIFPRNHFPLLTGEGARWQGCPIITETGAPPVVTGLAPEILCLPLHGRISPHDAARITGTITEFFGKR